MKRLDPALALGGALAFLVPFIVYLRTMSHTLNFWDCGEFITTSYILGIPHPPATPMYVLVGRLASILPFGDGVAHRINMMSGLFAALATLIMFMLIMKVTRQWFGPESEHGIHKYLRLGGALTATFLLAFSDTFWTNAIEAEVYSLSAFLMGSITWLILDWREKVDKPEGNALVYLIIYLLSLGVGFHLGTILIFPGFFIMALMIREKAFSDLEILAVGLFLAFFLGSAIMHWDDSLMGGGMLGLLLLAIQFKAYGVPLPVDGEVRQSSKRVDAKKNVSARFSVLPLIVAGGIIFWATLGDPKFLNIPGLIMSNILPIAGLYVLLATIFGSVLVLNGFGRHLIRTLYKTVAYSAFLALILVPLMIRSENQVFQFSFLVTAGVLAGIAIMMARGHGNWENFRGQQYKKCSFSLAAIGLFALGISVHLFLLIRAGQNPIINEANPSNWENLWAVIKREQYPARSVFVREASWGFQLQHFWDYLWNQFRMPFQGRFLGLNPGAALTALPLGLVLIGLWQQWRRQRKVFVALLIILLINTLGLVLFLNFTDGEVRERDYFYAPGFYFIALFIGLGAVGLLEGFLQETRGKRLAGGVAMLLLLLSLGPAIGHWHEHDRSDIYIARDYAWNMLAPLDENSVIFTNGDNDTFPLWYIQEVEGFRKDVRVVNLSLLNTDWYMAQLRDIEPKLPITLTDRELAEVARMWFQMEDGRVYQPRDKVIDHLFGNTMNEGWDSRAYYFAVTVPRDFLTPLLPFLKMEGMVYRMTLEQGEEQLDMARLRENLEEVFIWRGLQPDWNDQDDLRGRMQEASGGDSIGGVPSILPESRRYGALQGLKGEIADFPDRAPDSFYMNPTIRHLIQNYAAAWSRYAIELDRGVEIERDTQKSVEAMTRAWIIDQDFSPAVNYLGYLIGSTGDSELGLEAYKHFADINKPQDYRFWARYAQALEKAGKHEEVVQALGMVIDLNPDYEPGYLSLVDYIVSYFPTLDNVRAVVLHLEDFMRRHPDSAPVRERLNMMRAMLQDNSTSADN